MNNRNVNKRKPGKKCRENMMKQEGYMNQETKMKGKKWLIRPTMIKVNKCRKWKMREDISKRSSMD